MIKPTHNKLLGAGVVYGTTYVTEFAITGPNCTRTEIQFIAER